MSEWIRIRVKDFYKDTVGEIEYTYVTREIYEALTDTFRKEAHAQEMGDIRYTTREGYKGISHKANRVFLHKDYLFQYIFKTIHNWEKKYGYQI